MDTEYNGWKNYQTWNVALWIGNDYGLYTSACAFMRDHSKSHQPYRAFIKHCGMENSYTPDRVKWLSSKLDYSALNEMMKELI